MPSPRRLRTSRAGVAKATATTATTAATATVMASLPMTTHTTVVVITPPATDTTVARRHTMARLVHPSTAVHAVLVTAKLLARTPTLRMLASDRPPPPLAREVSKTSTRFLPTTNTLDNVMEATASIKATTRDSPIDSLLLAAMRAQQDSLTPEMPTVMRLATPSLLTVSRSPANSPISPTMTTDLASTEVRRRRDTTESTTTTATMVPLVTTLTMPMVATKMPLSPTTVMIRLTPTAMLLIPARTKAMLTKPIADLRTPAMPRPTAPRARVVPMPEPPVSNLSTTMMATVASAMVRMLPAMPVQTSSTQDKLLASTIMILNTRTTLITLPLKMLVLKTTATMANVPIVLSTTKILTTPTSDQEPHLTDPLRNMVEATDMLSQPLMKTSSLPSPLRPTVMPLSRTVPVATNSEELLLPLPTRPDTRRTSTESGVASTAPRSDTESLAPRPMRLTPTVVVPLRTTVHALVLLASAPLVRLAADPLLPLLTVPTAGAVPAATGELLRPVRLVLAPMPVASTMAPLRATPTLATNPTPTLPPMLATRASPTPLVATVTLQAAAPVTDHSVMPPPEASVTNGPAREVLRAPRATAGAMPTRMLTPTASMPLLATTPLLSPHLASELETRLLLPTASDRLAALDTPTPPLPVASDRVPPVDSEMAATVVSPDTVARRPTVPTTESTVTSNPVEQAPPVVPSAVVASALPATPSAVVVPLTTLASAVPVSDVDSPRAAPTSDALVATPPVETTTVMLTLVPEVLPPVAPLSAVTATLATAVLSAALVPLAPVASLLVTTTVHTTMPLDTARRDTVALRATVATPDTPLATATVETVDPLSTPVDTPMVATVLATVVPPVSAVATAATAATVATVVATVATVATVMAATAATADTEQMRMEVMDIEHYDQV